jgi:hypothetical protein
MHKVNKKSFEIQGKSEVIWGELIGVENLTGHQRAFTVVIRGGSFLIVNDKGEERLAGPDDSLNRREILREVMSQFNVHSLITKRPA